MQASSKEQPKDNIVSHLIIRGISLLIISQQLNLQRFSGRLIVSKANRPNECPIQRPKPLKKKVYIISY